MSLKLNSSYVQYITCIYCISLKIVHCGFILKE